MAKQEPEEKKKSGGCFLWGGLAVLGIGIILAVMYGDDAARAVKVSKTVLAVKQLAEHDIPRLRQTYPFDAAKPPAFDPDLFARYCQARNDMALAFQNLLKRTDEMRALAQGGGDPLDVLERAAPLAEDMRRAIQGITPALERAQLSPEAFRWIATQTWGLVADAALGGDVDAGLAIEALQDTAIQFGASAKIADANMLQVAEGVLDRLGGKYNISGDKRAWQTIRAGWDTWYAGSAASIVDLGFVEYLEKGLREIEKLGKK